MNDFVPSDMAYPTETSLTEDCFKHWFISATEAVNYNIFFERRMHMEAHIGRIQKGPDEILRY